MRNLGGYNLKGFYHVIEDIRCNIYLVLTSIQVDRICKSSLFNSGDLV